MPTQASLRAKTFHSGTHRVCSPEETLRRVLPKLAQFGITRVADVTGLDTIGIPVYTCMRPNARSLSVSQGKGLHREHARVSAIMESIELFHAENVVLPRVRGSFAELATRQAIDPRTLSLLPNGRYHDELPLDWVSSRDIARGQDVLVPYEAVHCDFVHRAHAEPPVFLSGSNGLASGNDRMEAISHALCELIERDATGVFRRSGCFTDRRIGEFLIDLDSVEDVHFQELRRRIDAAELALFAWNETSDIGVPSIGCALIDPRQDSPSAVYCGGYGAHLSREIALCRAVTEAAQSRLTEISGGRDDLRRTHYQAAYAAHMRVSGLRSFTRQRAMLDFSRLPSLATDDIARDVEVLVEKLGRRGFDRVVVADLTRPEHGIAVVKAIVPQLARFGRAAKPPRSNLDAVMS